MPAYFSMGTKSSDQVSQRYLHINNCGFCEALEKTTVSRSTGRKDYQLISIKSGQMLFELDGQKLPLDGGYVFLYRPGTPQHYRIEGEATTFFWIHFTGSQVEEILSDLPEGCIRTGPFPEFERYCKSFYMDCQCLDTFQPLHYEGALISLFAAIAKKASGTPKTQHSDRLDKALLAMNRSLSPRLSNEELAQLCGLDKYYFIKLFKQATGLTPQQYYASLIVERGKALLENTDYSVGEIAALCGVEDGFYFSRLFKKHTGVSPAGYRK